MMFFFFSNDIWWWFVFILNQKNVPGGKPMGWPGRIIWVNCAWVGANAMAGRIIGCINCIGLETTGTWAKKMKCFLCDPFYFFYFYFQTMDYLKIKKKNDKKWTKNISHRNHSWITKLSFHQRIDRQNRIIYKEVKLCTYKME